MKKHFLFVFLLQFVLTATCQSIHWGMNLAPNITIPLGNSNVKFWRFPQDSDAVYSNIKGQKKPQFGFSVAPTFYLINKLNSKLDYVIEGNVAYNLTRYNIRWNFTYQSPSVNNGSGRVFYGVTTQEIGLLFLPGVKYKQWVFQAGLSLACLVSAKTKRAFSVNGLNYIDETSYSPTAIKIRANKIVNIAMPFSIAYHLKLMNNLYLQPFVEYNLGLFNYDSYWMGNSSIRAINSVSQLKFGTKVLFLTKKKQ